MGKKKSKTNHLQDVETDEDNISPAKAVKKFIRKDPYIFTVSPARKERKWENLGKKIWQREKNTMTSPRKCIVNLCLAGSQSTLRNGNSTMHSNDHLEQKSNGQIQTDGKHIRFDESRLLHVQEDDDEQNESDSTMLDLIEVNSSGGYGNSSAGLQDDLGKVYRRTRNKVYRSNEKTPIPSLVTFDKFPMNCRMKNGKNSKKGASKNGKRYFTTNSRMKLSTNHSNESAVSLKKKWNAELFSDVYENDSACNVEIPISTIGSEGNSSYLGKNLKRKLVDALEFDTVEEEGSKENPSLSRNESEPSQNAKRICFKDITCEPLGSRDNPIELSSSDDEEEMLTEPVVAAVTPPPEPILYPLPSQDFIPLFSTYPERNFSVPFMSTNPCTFKPPPQNFNLNAAYDFIPPAKIKWRPVVIDGRNVGYHHGRNKVFSYKGLVICVRYFLNLGCEEIYAFLPSSYEFPPNRLDNEHLKELSGHIIYIPSRRCPNGRSIYMDDDRIIIEYATRKGAVIVTNDNFCNFFNKVSREQMDTISHRTVRYMFAGDDIIFPSDQFGSAGPEFLDVLKFW